jgi:hypothetical protein
MPDVFEVLGQDHAEVKYMLTVLEETPGQSAGAAEEVLDARKQLAEQLVIESSRHEAAEEQHFWPAVRARLGDGDQLAGETIGQESQAKEVLAKVDKLEASDPEFDRLNRHGRSVPVATPASQRRTFCHDGQHRRPPGRDHPEAASPSGTGPADSAASRLG